MQGSYNSATLQVPGEDRSAAWVVTPGGAWCRSIYIAGVLTELEDTRDLTRCRIADPTGGFDIVLHGTGTPCAQAMKKIPVPSFVTVTGQARMFRKNNTAILTVSPDTIVPSDRTVRDQWVLTTAETTSRRLELLQLAILNQCTDDRMLAAYRHYGTTPEKLKELAAMVENAVLAVRPPEASCTRTGGTFAGGGPYSVRAAGRGEWRWKRLSGRLPTTGFPRKPCLPQSNL